jgi:hypothetical protein
VVEDGIAVTSPFRTIFDLAAALEMRELERAFHEAEARELRDRVRTIRITWRQLRDEPAALTADLRLALEQPGPTHSRKAR